MGPLIGAPSASRSGPGSPALTSSGCPPSAGARNRPRCPGYVPTLLAEVPAEADVAADDESSGRW